MSRPIAYDITRLFLGPLSRTPRGIDRVELVLANHFFGNGEADNVGVLPTPWGMRIYDAARVRRGLARIERLWAENRHSDDDFAWTSLRKRLVNGANETYQRPRPISVLEQVRRLGSLLLATGVGPGKSAIRHIPRSAIYLNVGQISLAVPRFLRWLERRADITSVFMLHDVIPLENPEFVSSSSARHHGIMVASTARHADAVIVTTDHARSTVTAALSRMGRPRITTLARGLPLPSAFLGSGRPRSELTDLRYFVVCGSIEPRKNHSLLHTVWKRLAAQLGEATPHLVIVGSPGWNSDTLLAALENCFATRRRIHPVSGLSSPALKELILGADGLLMPSWNEGFGLPVLEANALGVPVIASDIPSHREIATPQTLLLNPGDPEAWEAALTDWHLNGPPSVLPAHEECTSDVYCRDVSDFLERCALDKTR